MSTGANMLQEIDRRRMLAGFAGLMVLGATGCGYILYPERRGRVGGQIDVPVLIIDLLWLLAGLVPGAICLIVDFTSGCIYGGGSASNSAPRGHDPRVATVQVELDGEIIATGQVQPDRRTELHWTRSVDEDTLRAKARVVVRANDGALAHAELRALI